MGTPPTPVPRAGRATLASPSAAARRSAAAVALPTASALAGRPGDMAAACRIGLTPRPASRTGPARPAPPRAAARARAGPDRVPDRPGRLGDRLRLDLVTGRPADGPGHARAEPALVVGRRDDRPRPGAGPGAPPPAPPGSPAARRMPPATPEPSQPSLLAALTTASVPAAVMSPCQTHTSVAPRRATLRRSSIFPPIAVDTVPPPGVG